MAAYVVGFEEETYRDYVHGLKQLLSYDPDQIQLLYVTPHRWTPYFRLAAERQVIQTDQQKWDYKHQVLSTRHMPPWQVLMWVKFIEAVMQLRPRSLRRVIAHHDLSIRDAMRWYYRIGRRVWFYEIGKFLFESGVKRMALRLQSFGAHHRTVQKKRWSVVQLGRQAQKIERPHRRRSF